MGDFQLPALRALNSAFKERGREDVIMIDVFPIHDGELLKLTFESSNSLWRQGVWLRSDKFLVVNGSEFPSVQVWKDTAPSEVLLRCHCDENILHLYNIWDRGQGRASQSWSSGMLVEELTNGRRYSCNDIGFETSFDKLIFRLERVSVDGSSART
jgi:hypothetical protein